MKLGLRQADAFLLTALSTTTHIKNVTAKTIMKIALTISSLPSHLAGI